MDNKTIEFTAGLRVGVRKQQYSREEWFIGVVEKTTKTQIVLTTGERFKIEYPYQEYKARNAFDVVRYLYPLTPEIEDKAFRQKAIAQLKQCDWSKVDSDKLRKIVEILDNP